jgi:hypothetical protein
MRHLLQSQLEELERLETEKERTVGEVRRRIELLDEVMSWRVPGAEPEEEFPLEDGLQDVDEDTVIKWGNGSGP